MKAPAAVTLKLFIFSLSLTCNYIFAEDQRGMTNVILWDGLESKVKWSIVSGSDKDRLYLSGRHKTEGQSSLEVNIGMDTSRDLSKGIILKREEVVLDINKAKGIILDIYNTDRPFTLVLALNTDGLHESFPKRIESGLNENIIFDLRPTNFNPPLGAEEIAQRLFLIIYPEEEILNPIYFDNIRVHQYGGTEFTPTFSPSYKGMVAEGYSPPETPGVEHLYSLPGWTTGEEPSPPVIYELKTLFLFGIGLVGIVIYHKKHNGRERR